MRILYIIFIFLIGFLACFLPTKDLSKNWFSFSQIFYNFGVGFGALVAGIGGFKLISEYLSSRKKQSLISNYKNKYPKEKLNDTFKIVRSPVMLGKIYIIDLKTNTKHWIKSLETLTDLDFYFDDAKDIDIKEFDGYTDGDGMLTSGIPGS